MQNNNSKRPNRKSYRLRNWDYSWDAAYCVTICTKGMQHCLGYVENGEMKLSNVGVIANVMWHEIKNHASNVKLDVFQVMPNHIHGCQYRCHPISKSGKKHPVINCWVIQISGD